MKAIPPLLPCTLAAVHFFAFPLLAETPAPMSEAVSRLEASKTFGVTPSGSSSNNSSLSQPNVTGTKNEADISRVLDNDPFKSPLFAPPPPDALPQTPQPPRPNRRYERTLTKEQEKEREKENNWLIHGVEEQTKLMEETAKSPLANDADTANKKAEAERKQSKWQEDGSRLDSNKKPSSTLSNPLNNGLGIYSRYTLKGMESMQQPSGSIDPLSMDARDHASSLKTVENPADSAVNAANIQSPILDPMASTKMTLNAKTPVATPNARLSVDDWLSAVKERERASLQPQQAPTVQNFYDQYQVRPKAPEPKPAPPPVVYNRPKAESMKNSIPPNRTIKDPNEF